MEGEVIMMEIYLKFTNWLSRILKDIATTLFLLFFAALILQVVFRYFLRSPLVWTEELAKLLNVWIVLLGSAIAVKDDNHINVDLLNNIIAKFGNKTKIAFYIITKILAPVTLILVLLKGSFVMMVQEWSLKFTTLPISQGLIYMPLFISSIIMLIFLLENLMKILKGEVN